MPQDSFQSSPPYPPQNHFEEDTISLMDILLVLAKNLKLIIITPAIFCIFTIVKVFFIADDIYVSRATFMFPGSGGEESQMIGFAAQFGFAMPNRSVTQWSHTDVIKSRKLARSMLDRKFDTKKYGSQKTLLEILTYGDEEPAVGIDTLIKNGISAVQSMIEISSLGSIYELEISLFNPQLAADVANAVIEEVDRHQGEYNVKKATETRQFIEERILATESELEKAEEALKLFRERNRSILESPQLQLEQERLGRDVAVLIGVFTTLRQQLETAKIEEVKESDYVVILDEPEVPLYPANQQKRTMVVLAGFLGIGCGILFAFLQEYIQNSDEEHKKKMGRAKSLIKNHFIDLLPKLLKNR